MRVLPWVGPDEVGRPRRDGSAQSSWKLRRELVTSGPEVSSTISSSSSNFRPRTFSLPALERAFLATCVTVIGGVLALRFGLINERFKATAMSGVDGSILMSVAVGPQFGLRLSWDNLVGSRVTVLRVVGDRRTTAPRVLRPSLTFHLRVRGAPARSELFAVDPKASSLAAIECDHKLDLRYSWCILQCSAFCRVLQPCASSAVSLPALSRFFVGLLRLSLQAVCFALLLRRPLRRRHCRGKRLGRCSRKERRPSGARFCSRDGCAPCACRRISRSWR